MKDPSPARLNVWLIEDHRAYGERLMRALNRLEGIRCTQRFTACEDALAALRDSSAPNVILLDIGLPGISGIEGITLLRERAPNCATVILTVFEDDEKILRAIRAGAVGYLLKTATPDEIAAALHAVAAGGSPMTPRVARRVLAQFSRADPPQRDYGLTPRERDILELLVKGLTIKETAAQLGIGFYTADEYIRSVYVKLQVPSRGGAIAKAIREGLVPPIAR
jgi:DNA-binding NarL/FixJ family response regulator